MVSKATDWAAVRVKKIRSGQGMAGSRRRLTAPSVALLVASGLHYLLQEQIVENFWLFAVLSGMRVAMTSRVRLFTLALTPTLSPVERENHMPLLEQNSIHGFPIFPREKFQTNGGCNQSDRRFHQVDPRSPSPGP
jgi:hypothetical protein